MNPKHRLGMVGLGVMGRNLALNMAEHGWPVAGLDTDPAKVEALNQEGRGLDVRGINTIEELVQLLDRPRAIVMLVPAGAPVDAVIEEALPHLQEGDILIDGGNSHFVDTDDRQTRLAEHNIALIGMGISGGEEGARRGPSLMPGGPKEAWETVRPVFEAVAAKFQDEPCVAWLGPGSAGHYVKMVHNGIEYGLIELIAESYDLMHRGLHMTDDELHSIFAEWNRGELQSYLIEITADIFSRRDEKTGRRLIEVIQDRAHQKGTGLWASEDALELRVPVPTIDIAVAMRDLSDYQPQRVTASQCLVGPNFTLNMDRKTFLEELTDAVFAGMILTYAQGIALLKQASSSRHYDLNLETVARIWRAGCIIRSAFLETIRQAYSRRPEPMSLMMDPRVASELIGRQEALRFVVARAAEAGIPIPGFMSTLAYFDGYRSGKLPANLIQAQRDYFGAHTYERVDEPGAFHTDWSD